MITQREISKLAFQVGTSDRIIEKDYVLTWILLALAQSDLGKVVAFKGGTALKKIYFPDYRYSEDLDFTLIEKSKIDEILAMLDRLLDGLAKVQGFQFAVPPEKIEKRADSLTAYINFVGPLQARLGSREIKVDFTLSEKLIFPVRPLAVDSAYSDSVDGKVVTYSLEEILIEKLCALIGRTEPRDLYDTNFLFSLGTLDDYLIPDAFKAKAEFKRIDQSRLMDALERKKATFARMWDTRLRDQIKDLPSFEEIYRELKRHLKKHFEF